MIELTDAYEHGTSGLSHEWCQALVGLALLEVRLLPDFCRDRELTSPLTCASRRVSVDFQLPRRILNFFDDNL